MEADDAAPLLYSERILRSSFDRKDPFADLLSTELNPPREELLRKFLDEINRSIDLTTVREQLKNAGVLVTPVRPDGQLEESPAEPLEVDVVTSGGGMKGFYAVGAWSVLRYLIKQKVLKVRRWAGASVGACSAMYMCCDVDPVRWAQTYYECRVLLLAGGASVTTSFKNCSDRIMPDDAAERCSGKVFISITHMSLSGPKNVVVSEFATKEDLIDACMASSTIPFLTTKTMGRVFRGQSVLDGGVTNNLPIFKDGQGRPQLIWNLSNVPYTSSLVLKLGDTCIESLVLRGALEMSSFVIGKGHPRKMPIKWESGAKRREPPSPVRKLVRGISEPVMRMLGKTPEKEEEEELAEEESAKLFDLDYYYSLEISRRQRSDTESAMGRRWYWKWLISAQRGLKATYFTYFLSACFMLALIPPNLSQRLRLLRLRLFKFLAVRWLARKRVPKLA